ncbi:MAG: alpha/beta hydrolase [Desulfobacterales bacterium]|nr:alpha/beta hydrolase [Desulfobacterales bacterium]MBF0396617.1 alpha/beta hydrolase [Desulfobacterales bacterium]
MEEKILFKSKSYQIEGLISKNNNKQGVVITHPHPLYGGDMYNYVVESIANTFQRKGYITLRFNFRGVGASQGNYDNGIGEQDDVLSAISCLNDMGIKPTILAGYSFGTWVNAMVNLNNTSISQIIMVSPPVSFMNFSAIKSLPYLKLIVTGSEDDIAPSRIIQKMISIWNNKSQFEIIKGADHFYAGYLKRLEEVIYESKESI